ncbi:FAD/NAD(P)-binding domain-containing protein [Pisolithus orientalis]|uniref:FAD/NAD(P)-binding domain-containing protein n=1 Tax=Pisolithus orientalis TaxID=936130 RepID=UPI002224A0C0|nr:FAD/NAD(P)-binding domain-containing protein [Pisolithus orientalis]KAI6007630.1 FAD/NAD(P)-binding domain-containing protein [Pisolithus orientalis]
MAGHKVTILESTATVGEFGAGLVISPNVTRQLIRWGLEKRLQEVAVSPSALNIRHWCTGETVSWKQCGDSMVKNYGAPLFNIHRADLHRMLYDLAEPRVTIRTNCRVVAMDPSVPSLTLKSGEVVRADLVVGADGLWSVTRQYVIGRPDERTPSGDATYRAVLPTELLLADPELRVLAETPEMVVWFGPQRRIVAYNIRGMKEYNMVMCHPDQDPEGPWKIEESSDRVKEEFVGWEPRIQKLLSLIPSAIKWRLMDHAPLETWVHKGGKLTLLGDACHPVLPYGAQGAAMAIEDAAVLGNLFSRLFSRAQIAPLLHAYEAIRYDRATNTQAFSRLRRTPFHLSDDREQEQHDEQVHAAMEDSLRAARGGAPVGTDTNVIGNANQPDREREAIQFRYDADKEAERWWREHGESEVGLLGMPSTS